MEILIAVYLEEKMEFQVISFQFFRRKAREVNGFNESLKFNEDFELILRISKNGNFLA